ncbi:fibrinogen C domain-containing protein 1-like [Actinia tenebrosa]|uniref:Fibrinogen C domain-containing protein 1-like n=1 Tax=Actinia tenebrosa TaxID=6105 RepID=A0A6P8HHX1_ACTTE|nr:fibrinogen C domain-containing protein 1-like [Actinia tenebrosa]
MDPSPCQNHGTCYPDYDNDDYHCVCKPATRGRNCEAFYSDCSALLASGCTTDGIYKINPDGRFFQVYCDMTTDGGGWTVFQKRNDGSVNFYRGWQDYKTGFGSLTGEFWLGLHKIHRLTKRQVTKLRVDLVDLMNHTSYAEYSSFSVADGSELYRLNVSGYSGTAGDALHSNNERFSTFDKDNDGWSTDSCAAERKGGWWYEWCSVSDLNGMAETFWTYKQAFKNTEMKLK